MKNIYILFFLLTLCLSAYSDNYQYSTNESLADAIIKESPVTMIINDTTRKQVDKHYYMSLAVYAWPDPNNPSGPYITRDGEINPEWKEYDKVNYLEMVRRVVILADAFDRTGDTRYAECCLTQLKCWFLDSNTLMYPNFEYGQVIPGKNNGHGNPGAVCEALELVKVLNAIEKLNTQNAIPHSTYKKLRKWFNALRKWLQTSRLGLIMSNQKDNLGVIYDQLLYSICTFTGNSSVCKSIEKNFAARRINPHIQIDGKQPNELKRTRAMHYSIYNLGNIIDFCYLTKKNGTNFYQQNSERIDNAMSYLYQFVGNRDKFPYQEIGDWDSLEEYLKREMDRLTKLKNMQ